MGDRSREFRVSNGKTIKGLSTGTGYVPLTEVRRLGAAVIDDEDAGGRFAQIIYANKSLRVDEYRARLTVDGQVVSAPPPIPYDADLWVPVRAVVEALGFTITG
jgi:hypothetical protein